jgi:hypothetical protein
MFPIAFPSWLKSLTRTGKRGRSQPRLRTRGFRPHLEGLETRLIPSANVWTGAVAAITNPADINWSTGGNWSLGRAPQAGDTLVFTSATVDPAVQVVSSTDDIPSLSGVTLAIDSTWDWSMTIAGALALSGTSDWQSGVLTMASGASIVNNGTFALDGPSAVALDGPGSFVNNGTMTATYTPTSQGGVLNMGTSPGDTPSLLNSRGAVYQLLGAATINGGSMVNKGTINASAGAAPAIISSPLLNDSGTVTVLSGMLQLNNNDVDANGTFRASANAILDLDGNLDGGFIFTENATFTATGNGTILLADSGTFAAGSASVNMKIAPSVTFQWTNAFITIPAGDTLTCTGALDVYNPENYDASSLSGSGTFILHGTLTQSGPGFMGFANDSGGALTWIIAPGSTYNIQDDTTIYMALSGGQIVNRGAIKKTAGPGTFLLSVPLNNSGLVQAGAGTLTLNDNDTDQDGTFKAAAGATLDLTGGDIFTETGTFTGIGSGTLLLGDDGGTFAAGGAAVACDISPSTHFTWSNGTFSVPAGATLTYNGPLSARNQNNQASTIAGLGTFALNGTLTQSGSGIVSLAGNTLDGPTLDILPGSVFDMESDTTVNGSGVLVNAGTIEKTHLAGTAKLSARLDNTCTLLVNSGTVAVTGGVSQISQRTLTGGTWEVSATGSVPAVLTLGVRISMIGQQATVIESGPKSAIPSLTSLAVNAGSFSLDNGRSFTTVGAFTNAGTLTLSPGSVLTVNGNFTQQAGGVLNVEMGGTDSNPAIGSITTAGGGNITLNGALHVSSTVTPAPMSPFVLLANGSGLANNGIFAGLQEGASFAVTVGSTTMIFQITYAGGSNQDLVEITRVS